MQWPSFPFSGLWWFPGEAGERKRLLETGIRPLFRSDNSQQWYRWNHKVSNPPEVKDHLFNHFDENFRILERALEKINSTPQWVPISWVYWRSFSADNGEKKSLKCSEKSLVRDEVFSRLPKILPDRVKKSMIGAIEATNNYKHEVMTVVFQDDTEGGQRVCGGILLRRSGNLWIHTGLHTVDLSSPLQWWTVFCCGKNAGRRGRRNKLPNYFII